jgi:hypothetical protein
MERSTTNEAHSGSLRDASSLHFREQTPGDAARESADATITFEGGIRLSLDDELRCDPYNRRGRLMRRSG